MKTFLKFVSPSFLAYWAVATALVFATACFTFWATTDPAKIPNIDISRVIISTAFIGFIFGGGFWAAMTPPDLDQTPLPSPLWESVHRFRFFILGAILTVVSGIYFHTTTFGGWVSVTIFSGIIAAMCAQTTMTRRELTKTTIMVNARMAAAKRLRPLLASFKNVPREHSSFMTTVDNYLGIAEKHGVTSIDRNYILGVLVGRAPFRGGFEPIDLAVFSMASSDFSADEADFAFQEAKTFIEEYADSAGRAVDNGLDKDFVDKLSRGEHLNDSFLKNAD